MKNKQIEMQERVHNYSDGKYELASEYVNMSTKFTIRCMEHNELFDIKPGHYFEGIVPCKKCRHKKFEDAFYEKALKLYGDNIEFLTDYIDGSSKITARCKMHDYTFTKTAGLISLGHGCPFCSGYKISPEDYKKQVEEKHGSNFSLLTEYVNHATPIKVRHNICGKEYKISPQSFLEIKQCRHCEELSRRKYTIDDVRKIFDEHGMILVGDDYTMTGIPVPYICKNHPELGVQRRKLSSVLYLNQQGCPQCAAEERGKALRVDDKYYKTIVENMGYEFVKITRDEISYRPMVHYICPRHRDAGVQVKTANSFINNKGCPLCRESKGERLIRSYLNKHHIDFEQWKTFDDLRGTGDGKLSYDFFIQNFNLLIEFQGLQHYQESPMFYKENASMMFEKQQEHDRRKREYAARKGYVLLEIPYNKMKSVDKILDDFFIVRIGCVYDEKEESYDRS